MGDESSKPNCVKAMINKINSTADRFHARLAEKIKANKFASLVLQAFGLERLFTRLAAAYFLALVQLMISTDLGIDTRAYTQSINLTWMIAKIVIIFLVATTVSLVFGEKFDYLLFACSLFAVAWVISYKYRNYFVILCGSVAFTVLFLYAMRRGMFKFSPLTSNERIGKISSAATLILLFAIPAVIISLITCVRYLNFVSPNFDFGIFVNMFHNMSQTGLPMTTNERNILLSHFAIHLSPILYLILPFYMIFPSPLTLQIAQAVILASSVFPMYLICREKNLNRVTSLLFCAVLAFYPGMTGGTFYDMHENCFLKPLLLWTFYFFERGKFLSVLFFSLLVCMVKEDAPVYIAFFAAYAFFAESSREQKMQRLKAIIYGVFALIYFYFALKYLQTHGTGVMLWRYGQYAVHDESLSGIVTGIFLNPSLVLYNMFAVDTLAKLIFIVQLLLPLLFFPLITNKPGRFILLFPMLLLNLMPSWRFQYDIGFHYQFGSGAFLLYATLLNFADFSWSKRRTRGSLTPHRQKRKLLYPEAAALCMLCVTLFVYSAVVYANFNAVRNFGNNREMRAAMNRALQFVPPDASVSASTFILPHLAQRDVIYEFAVGCLHNIEIVDGVPILKNETEYIVIDMRWAGFNRVMYDYFSSSGDWEIVNEDRRYIAVLRDVTW